MPNDFNQIYGDLAQIHSVCEEQSNNAVKAARWNDPVAMAASRKAQQEVKPELEILLEYKQKLDPNEQRIFTSITSASKKVDKAITEENKELICQTISKSYVEDFDKTYDIILGKLQVAATSMPAVLRATFMALSSSPETAAIYNDISNALMSPDARTDLKVTAGNKAEILQLIMKDPDHPAASASNHLAKRRL